MPRPAQIGVFGGTFDPIHSGHLAVARAALRRFHLDRIYFVPSGLPPHKSRNRLTPYVHRYAMVVLACAGERRFIPSLLEAGPGSPAVPGTTPSTRSAACAASGHAHGSTSSSARTSS